ncbi:hypothetical protein PENARI_c007G02049 [Penicillium arizonense]|uniref:Uncharacterized protein n=1 Tax=Penicillium arizonense TaxID=1835702 RepID=A0A1F5LKN1_PENAI|nr:hypothetical protein PENARI_c007G02049 [Penicillium arizonense]OGE53491.1 hypothetical protein PENARI_c007G02049 [Penicillium arizonense]
MAGKSILTDTTTFIVRRIQSSPVQVITTRCLIATFVTLYAQ